MSFFAQLQPDPYTQQWGQLGRALGEGINKNFPDPQQMVQRDMLRKAMSNLPENANYLDILKTVGPEFMTTPGGSQLLAEMGPLLQKESQGKAYLNYLNQNQPQSGQNTSGNNSNVRNTQNTTGTPLPVDTNEVVPYGQDYFKNPKPPVGKQGTYPKMSALPEPIPLLTPEEMQQRSQQLTAQSLAQGHQPDPVAIENLIGNEQNRRINFNQNIEKEREIRETKQQNQSARMLKRFDNAHPNSTAEDQTVFEKFANEAKDAANENDAYTYARAKYNQYDNAKNALLRESDVPNFVTKMYRTALGTYKSKENVIKDLQPHIKKLKDLGLENEARAILSNNVGLGMEDTELAMNPLTKKESDLYDKISSNPKANEIYVNGRYPGQEAALDPERFIKFKDEIADILQKNPDSNLAGMRGILNAGKKYAWTDISTAIAELIEEGRFEPNPIQEQQLNVVKSPPIPGLGAMFTEFFKGTR